MVNFRQKVYCEWCGSRLIAPDTWDVSWGVLLWVCTVCRSKVMSRVSKRVFRDRIVRGTSSVAVITEEAYDGLVGEMLTKGALD